MPTWLLCLFVQYNELHPEIQVLHRAFFLCHLFFYILLLLLRFVRFLTEIFAGVFLKNRVHETASGIALLLNLYRIFSLYNPIMSHRPICSILVLQQFWIKSLSILPFALPIILRIYLYAFCFLTTQSLFHQCPLPILTGFFGGTPDI